MTDLAATWNCATCACSTATDGFCDGCGSSTTAESSTSTLGVGARFRISAEVIEILRQERNGDWAARSASGRYYAASEWRCDPPIEAAPTATDDERPAEGTPPAAQMTEAPDLPPASEAIVTLGEDGGPAAGESQAEPGTWSSTIPIASEGATGEEPEAGFESEPHEGDTDEVMPRSDPDPLDDEAVELIDEIRCEAVRAVDQFLSTVVHPSLPASHLTGRLPDAPLQLLFIEVDPNADWIESQQLTSVAATRAGGQLAQLAHSAHGAGWVLSSLRPEVLRWSGTGNRVSITRLDGLCRIDEPAPPRTWGSWTAPEMQLGEPALPAADVYSIAMVIAASHGFAVDGDDGTLIEPVGSGLSLDLVALLRRCTTAGVDERPSLQFLARELGRLRTLLGARWAGATSLGRTREVQEDSWAAMTITGAAPGPAVTFAVVADGMGGADAGEVASRLAVRAAIAGFASAVREVTDGSLDPDHQVAAMRDAFVAAQEAVGSFAAEHPEARTLASTLTALSVSNGLVCVAHAGDSRLTLVRAGASRHLTTDHNVAARLLAIGEITPEEAASHPQRSTLYRCLNVDRNADPEMVSELLEEGDRLVLTSDGVHGLIDDDVLAMASGGSDPAAAAHELVSAAVRAGGYDNATAIVLQITSAVE